MPNTQAVSHPLGCPNQDPPKYKPPPLEVSANSTATRICQSRERLQRLPDYCTSPEESFNANVSSLVQVLKQPCHTSSEEHGRLCNARTDPVITPRLEDTSSGCCKFITILATWLRFSGSKRRIPNGVSEDTSINRGHRGETSNTSEDSSINRGHRGESSNTTEDASVNVHSVRSAIEDKEGSVPPLACQGPIASSSDCAPSSSGGCFLRRLLVRRSQVR